MINLFRQTRKAVFGYDVFISYSRKDGLDYAYAIAMYLAGKGYECYIDQLSSITPGNELPHNIRDAVKRSTALVAIGSEGSQHSAPVGLEIKLFLESNRNRPLIPVTIGDSAFGADWYPQVKGLALIDDTQENLQAATPAADVTNRIAAALAFTKKSVRLRRIALGTALLIAATAIVAVYFVRLAAQKITLANAKVAAAERRIKTALNQAAIAERRSKDAGVRVVVAYAKLTQVNHTLVQVNAKTKLLDRKNEVQNLIYNARLENELGNANTAMRYARTALQKEAALPGGGSAAATIAAFINNFMPKYLDKDAMNFHYAAYGADLKPYTAAMTVFPMNIDHTQLLAYTEEPKLKNAKPMMNDDNGYCPTWIMKTYTLGIMDIKHNNMVDIPTGKHEKRTAMNYRAYYIGPGKSGVMALMSEWDDSTGMNVKVWQGDTRLNGTSAYQLDTDVTAYLRELAQKNAKGDYYYIAPNFSDKNRCVIQLLHLASVSTLLIIPIDKKPAPKEEYTLAHMHYVAVNSWRPSYNYLKYLRVTDTSIFYMANDTLFCHDRRNGKETVLTAFTPGPCPSLTYSYSCSFALDGKEPVILISDSGSRITLLAQGSRGWQIRSRVTLSGDIDSVRVEPGSHDLVICTRHTYYHDRLQNMLDQVSRTNSYIPNIEPYYTDSKPNFHLVNDGNIKLVENNDPALSATLSAARPAMYQFSPGSNTLFTADVNSDDGKVSVSDISNVMLGISQVKDDPEFKPANFLDMPGWLLGIPQLVKDGKRRMIAEPGKLRIVDGALKKLYEPDEGVALAGFMKRPGFVYFITLYDQPLDKPIFNVYNYQNGFRYAYPLSNLLHSPSGYQITSKYIYFTENETRDGRKMQKMIRIVNPAVPYADLQNILAKSIY